VNENACRIDDFGPLPIMQPQSVVEIGDIVRRAAAEGQAIYPLGGRTLLAIGLPPARPGVAVDLRSLSQVLDYPARDMTITVQAGITMAQLQSLLATENQRLPIDVPNAEQATLGGVLATNVSGPRRLGFGTLRDYVIGISTINDQGQEVKAGGRVVKNVAGYDLCKLHIGALGTLGIINQVTLKLRPLPECASLVTFGCETAALDRVLDHLHATRTRPVCLDLLNQAAVRALRLNLPEAAWVIVVGFEDNSDAVNWQVRQLLQELAAGDIHGLEARAGAACEPLWRGLVENTLSGGRQPPEEPLGGLTPPAQGVTFKANLLPYAVAEFCRQADTLSEALRLHAHAGSGIVYGHLDGDLTLPHVAAMLKELTDSAVRAKGNLALPRCPVEWKRELPVWGSERGDLWLMRQVKDKLDSQNLFNPGRFLTGS
jgi:glycolate oxidase FAD binding subunit